MLAYTVGSELSEKLIYSAGSLENESVAYYCIAIMPVLSRPCLSVSNIGMWDKGLFPECLALFYPTYKALQ